MDLPLRKGLSSSAAMCVLVARAWSRLYDLGLGPREEMEIAYQGEILTPSQCGRMDQICAYGSVPCFLTFDADELTVEPIALGGELHLLIVDLDGSKDTVRILRDLNAQFPDTPGELARRVREALGPLNREILLAARAALERGDAAAVGALMRRAQELFDSHVAPACPSELRAPRLHRLLEYPPLQGHLLGGKGVGSQGDGTAQLLAASAASRSAARAIIEEDLGLRCLELTLRPAGRGGRD